MFNEFLIWIFQQILSDNPKNISADKLRNAFSKFCDNVENVVIAANSGLYSGNIEPSSSFPESTSKVFLVTTPGTYKNFGNVVLPKNYFGFIFKTGSTFSISKVEIPTPDMTAVNSAIDKMNDFIKNFKAEVDQDFNEESKNAIANKRVTPLAVALKSFISDTVEVVNLSNNAGNKKAYNKNLDIISESSSSNTTLFKQDISSVDYLKLKFRIPNVTTPETIQCLTFTKKDGTFYEYLAPNSTSVIKDFDDTIDVRDYTQVTLTWNYISNVPLVFFGYKGNILEEDSVKTYIDKQNSSINEVLGDFIGDLVLKKDQSGSSGDGNVYFKDLTLSNKSATNTSLLKVDISDIDVIDLQFTIPITSIEAYPKYSCVTFEKIDGKLISYQGWNTTPGLVFSKKINIKDLGYKSISVTWDMTSGNSSIPLVFKMYTGFENINLKEYIKENGGKGGGKVENEKLIHIDKPTTLPIINIIGDLPTDSTDARTPSNVEIEYIINNSTQFKCKSELAVQGNATAAFAKKGFEAVLTNYSDEELSVQFGGWPAFSEYHLKAYPNDQTFARDLTAGKIWHQLRTSRDFPKSYIADFNAGQQIDASKENLLEQALFFTDGFPVELRVDGQFYGLYVLRMKKDRDNYMLDNSNANHVFLDNEESIDWLNFTASNWKVRSPKIKGYKDGGEITDDALNEKFTRWWTWFKGINDGTIDFDSTVDNFLNVDSWVDALITQQLTSHWDYQSNNILLTSWDGLKLSVCYYDGDQTFGLVTSGINGIPFPLIIDSNGLYWRSDFWRTKLYPKLKTRIQQRYTELRNLKIIDSNNIYHIFKETTDLIPRKIYEKELKNWRINYVDVGKHSLRYCINWTNERIKKLDLIWKV